MDVIVRKSATIFELLSSEDKTLLIWGDTLLVLDLGLNVLNGVRGLDLKSDGLTSESLDEDLHTSTKTENQVQGRLLLDVVVGKSSAIFKLLSGEDQALLVWWDAFFVLDLCLDVLD